METVGTPLATISGLLVASERRRQVHATAIEVDHPGTQLRGNLACPLDIRGGYVARQPVDRVIGNTDCIGLVLVRQDRENGPENFLASKVFNSSMNSPTSSKRR